MPSLDGKQNAVVVIDLDDTILDIGPRRLALYRKHFPHAQSDDDTIRRDTALTKIGSRTEAPAIAFLADFANPTVLGTLPIQAIPGAPEAVRALEAAGLEVVLLTGRHHSLQDSALADLQSIGLDWTGKRLVMHDAAGPIDPQDETSFGSFKARALAEIAITADVIAAVGDRLSDVAAAVKTSIPAVLLNRCPAHGPTADNAARGVGFRECRTWSEALVAIAMFRAGEHQLNKLRDDFTAAYVSWLNNLNNLCAIDVAVASMLGIVSSSGVLAPSLPLVVRAFAAVPLLLAALAMVFAIRAFTSRYSSGPAANRTIVPRMLQTLWILLDCGSVKDKARSDDAIHEWQSLRRKPDADKANAHRDFFFKRYGTHDPRALQNLRMFEMRSANYVRAYAEHLSSRTLIWGVVSMAAWVLVAAWVRPAQALSGQNPPSSSISAVVQDGLRSPHTDAALRAPNEPAPVDASQSSTGMSASSQRR